MIPAKATINITNDVFMAVPLQIRWNRQLIWIQRFCRRSIVGDILWHRFGFFELEFKIGNFFAQQWIGNIILKDNLAGFLVFGSTNVGDRQLQARPRRRGLLRF